MCTRGHLPDSSKGAQSAVRDKANFTVCNQVASHYKQLYITSTGSHVQMWALRLNMNIQSAHLTKRIQNPVD